MSNSEIQELMKKLLEYECIDDINEIRITQISTSGARTTAFKIT